MLDPPLLDYAELYPKLNADPPHSTCGGPLGAERPWWTWDELEALPVPQIAASPGFIFLWCGTGQGRGLEQGRALLAKWGYRKCEDLVWVKTNHDRSRSEGLERDSKTKTVFTPTKEHCLMGIRGTVRRSTDGHFVNCNVDTDVIVADADPIDPLHKPVELYHLIENFCLGHRRLELFGSKRSLRRGWLTIGNQCAPDVQVQDDSLVSVADRPIPYVKQDYVAHFLDSTGRTQNLLPSTPEIETLRPRSPPGRIGTALAGPSGSPLPRGLGLGPSGPGSGPLGNHPGLMGATITVSGRNTISHPSGGLGRGPGNALLPGMRVSGFRDSGNNASVPGSANYKNPKPTSSPRGQGNRNLTPYIQGGQQIAQYPFGYHLPQMQNQPGMMMAGGGAMPVMHLGNMVPHMTPNHSIYPQPQTWTGPQMMGNSYGCPPFSNPGPMAYGQMTGPMQQYQLNSDARQTGFGTQLGGSRTPSASSFNLQQPYNQPREGSSTAYHQQPQSFQPTLNYPTPIQSPQTFVPSPSYQPSNLLPVYHDQHTFHAPQQQCPPSSVSQDWTRGTGGQQQQQQQQQ
ncbi:hypothetical protein CROQUDRAFT_360161 [Cronartium quercuum f. sp. fusiforme G11]|uniref:Uncharacterized protein n=1 Tax=Cronartium quercuum f. sp. fusiforme G11 TaxID=708437 RepID=A0A9P6NRI2_9BASI|nr:hypothetical protein CROQUDRAFT_360161 [Cronartium quercuum f. sp. fusiforme G11]